MNVKREHGIWKRGLSLLLCAMLVLTLLPVGSVLADETGPGMAPGLEDPALPVDPGFGVDHEPGADPVDPGFSVDSEQEGLALDVSPAVEQGDFAEKFDAIEALDHDKSGLFLVGSGGKPGAPADTAREGDSFYYRLAYFVSASKAREFANMTDENPPVFSVECPDLLVWSGVQELPLRTPGTPESPDGDIFATLTVDGSLSASITFVPEFFAEWKDLDDGEVSAEEPALSDADLYIECQLREDLFGPGEPTEQKISWSWGGELTISLPGNRLEDLELAKNGEYQSTDGRFHWTVAYTPGAGTDGSIPAALEDLISPDQILVADSIRVDGASPAPGTITMKETGDGLALRYTLPTPAAPVALTYETVLSDDGVRDGVTSVKNTAYALDAAGNRIGQSNEVSVSVPDAERSRAVKGGTYDDATKTITWTVDIRTQWRNLKNLTMTDRLLAGLELVPGSVSIQDRGGTPVSGTTVTLPTADSPELTIVFPGGKTAGYRVTYQTKVPQYDLDLGLTQHYTNNVDLTADWNIYGGDTPYQTEPWTGMGMAQVDTPLTSAILKAGRGYNTATGCITWEVTVNPNKIHLTEAQVTDDFTGLGLTYVEGTLPSGVTLSPDFTAKKPIFNISNVDGKAITFTFQTKVDDPDVFACNATRNYTNKVTLAGKVNGDSFPQTPIATATQRVASTVLAKTAGDYDYSDNTIDWTIRVNQNGMSMTGVTVVDTLPAGLNYQPGSTAGAIGEPVWDESARTLTFTLGDITEARSITYTTVVDVTTGAFKAQKSVLFENTAVLKRTNLNYDDVTARHTAQVNNTALGKSAVVDRIEDGLIQYTVSFNPNRIPLSGEGWLTDTMPAALQFDLGTVELHQATVAANGTLSAGDKVDLVLGETLKLDTDRNELSIRVPAGATAYLLTYDVDILQNGGVYQNKIAYTEFTSEDLGGQAGADTGAAGGGGGGVANRKGAVEITKTDADSGQPMAGVVFQLYQTGAPTVVLAQRETGADGKVAFRTLTPSVEYAIREITPAGYQPLSNPEVWKGTVTAKEQKTQAVSNRRIPGTIALTKINDWGRPVPGVTFTLAGVDLTGIARTAVTDARGVVTFSDVPFGRYTLTETAAPEYYTPGAVLAVEMDRNGNSTVTFQSGDARLEGGKLVNTVRKGSLLILKTDEATRKPMEGVTFTLYDSTGAERGRGATDDRGALTFLDLMLGERYTLRENTPAGYRPAADRVVDLTGDKLTGGVMTLNVTNTPDSGGGSGGGSEITPKPTPTPIPSVPPTPTPAPSQTPAPVPSPTAPVQPGENPGAAPTESPASRPPVNYAPDLPPERVEEIGQLVEQARQHPDLVIRDLNRLAEEYPSFDIQDLPVPLYWGDGIAVLKSPQDELVVIDEGLMPLGMLPQTGTARPAANAAIGAAGGLLGAGLLLLKLFGYKRRQHT